MPAVTIVSRVLKAIALDAKPLIPKGQPSAPMRIRLSGGNLYFIFRGVCTLYARIEVDTDEVADVTVNYLDISDYLPSDDTLTVDIASGMGVRIKSDEVDIILVPAFSTVDDIDAPDIQWYALENSLLVSALHAVSTTGLENLYAKSPPVEIYNKIAILKYPNIYVQARAPELVSNVSLTQECARLVQSFAPKEYAQISSDTLVFKKYDTYLYVPVKLIGEITTVKDVVKEDSVTIRLDLGTIVSKVSTMRKLGISTCDVVLYPNGLSITAVSNLSSITTSCGNREDNAITSFALPVQLLYIVLRLIGDAYIEICYKEGVLCLRTPTLAIAVHVLN